MQMRGRDRRATELVCVSSPVILRLASASRNPIENPLRFPTILTILAILALSQGSR